MAARESVEVELSQVDRALILQYGYPFPRIENAITSLDGSSSVETVALDRFYLKKLIENLWRSIKKSNVEDLRCRLDDLCQRLEFFERGGYTLI